MEFLPHKLFEVSCIEELMETINQLIDNQEVILRKLKEAEFALNTKGQNRNNNLIIFGVEDKSNENIDEIIAKIEEIIFNMLNIAWFDMSKLISVRRIGRYTQEKPRPILLEFISPIDKQRIMRVSHRLKGSNLWLNDDMSKEERRIRKCLIPFLKAERERGNSAFLVRDKIKVNGKLYSIEQCNRKNYENIEENEENTPNQELKNTSSYAEQLREAKKFLENEEKSTNHGLKNPSSEIELIFAAHQLVETRRSFSTSQSPKMSRKQPAQNQRKLNKSRNTLNVTTLKKNSLKQDVNAEKPEYGATGSKKNFTNIEPKQYYFRRRRVEPDILD